MNSIRFFFAYRTELPADAGFCAFGAAHCLWLAFLLASFYLALRAYRRLDGGRREKWHRREAAAAILDRWCMCGYYVIRGFYGTEYLPLHVCGMASYLVFLHAFFLRGRARRVSSEILFFPMLPGAAAALLFPGWPEYPPLSLLSICEFLGHGFIVLYCLLRLTDGGIRPDVRRAWIPAAFTACYALFFIPFDRLTGYDFGFLAAPAASSPLAFLAERFGTGAGYYVSYALLVLLCMAVSYAVLYFLRKIFRVS